MSELRKIGVYGVGHFGFAMLRHLQQKTPDSISIVAFDRNDGVRASLREQRAHPVGDEAHRIELQPQRREPRRQ